MRRPLDPDRLRLVLDALGRACRGSGVVYVTGGATALLEGWRGATVDLNLELDPEPTGAFAAITRIEEELEVNVELASALAQTKPRPRVSAAELRSRLEEMCAGAGDAA